MTNKIAHYTKIKTCALPAEHIDQIPDKMNLLCQYLLSVYRRLPAFRGKYRLGSVLFRNCLGQPYPEKVSVNRNLNFFLPNSIENIGKELMLKGEYEPDTVTAITTELKHSPNPVFFDVGANIGAIAIPVAKNLPSLALHAFEASPLTFRFLEKNFRENGLLKDKIVNKAIYSSSNLELKFFEATEYGKSSLAPTYTDIFTIVRSFSIDDYCRQQGVKKIDLVKVDVQGFEMEVFKGMRKMLLDKEIAAIYFEFEDWAETAAGFRPGSSQEYLIDTGYDIFDFSGRKLNSIVTSGRCMLWARPR